MLWHRKAERNSYKIMKRWRMLELHTAFTTYKTNVKQAIQDKALLRRAIQRIKYMRAHASLNQWISYVDTRCRVRRILESYFGRQNMANATKRLHRGWNLWCRYISKMKLSEMSADKKAAELKRQKALMKRMFSHMVYREIYSVAFAVLKRNVKYVAEKNHRLCKSIERYLRCGRQASLRRGFCIWLRRMQMAEL